MNDKQYSDLIKIAEYLEKLRFNTVQELLEGHGIKGCFPEIYSHMYEVIDFDSDSEGRTEREFVREIGTWLINNFQELT